MRRALSYCIAKEGLARYLGSEWEVSRALFQKAEVIAAGSRNGDTPTPEKYHDILFLSAFYQWKIAGDNGNPVQTKIAFGRLKHLRSSLERRFLEVQDFDRFIQGAKEVRQQ